MFYFFYSIPSINKYLKNKRKDEESKVNNIVYNYMTNENVHINNNEPENLILKNIKKYKKENIESKLNDNENELNNKKAPIKVCNYIVYIFFQKRIGNKEAYIF